MENFVPLSRFSPPHSSENDFFVSQEKSKSIIEKEKLDQPSWSRSIVQLGLALAFIGISAKLLTLLPWFLLPLGWALAGFALTQLFAIGNDCAFGNWSPSSSFNEIIGEASFLLLGQPFACFRARLAKLVPHMIETDVNKPAPGNAGTLEIPLVFGGISEYFDNYQRMITDPKERKRTGVSVYLSLAFLAVITYALYSAGGVFSVCKYWLFPVIAFNTMYAFAYTLLTDHIDAWLPYDLARKVASYNLPALAKSLRNAFPDAKFSNNEKGLKKLISKIHWLHVIILTGVPMISLYAVLFVPLSKPTMIWSIVYYILTGLGITAGYHRLWAHKSYEASRPVAIALMLFGSGAFEGSIKWWSAGHRVHHRYTDTPKDPYNAKYGFFYSHFGWMLQKPEKKVYADISDLNADPMIRFQHKHFLLIAPFMAFIFPALVAGLFWGDWAGGYFWAGAVRLLFVHHSTFCVNSVAHWIGEQTYDDVRSPRDSVITALLTLGEGYHNFHHEFPQDYRNGILFYHWDPTKWTISLLHALGLAYNLHEFPHNEIMKGQATMYQKKVEALNRRIKHPTPVNELPEMSYEQFEQEVKQNRKALTIVEGVVHDISEFIEDHPGGQTLIKSIVGADATNQFNGLLPNGKPDGLYKHSTAAHNLLSNYRVARLVGSKKTQ